jgi:hypothetical protein
MSANQFQVLFRFAGGGSIAVAGAQVMIAFPSVVGFDCWAVEGDALDALLLAAQRARANRPARQCNRRGGEVTRQRRTGLWVPGGVGEVRLRWLDADVACERKELEAIGGAL